MSVRIITDTRLEGLKALHRRITSDRRRVLVGVPKGKVEDDGTPIAMIAAVHEFGSPKRNIPERSFLRGGILRNLPRLRQLNADSMRKVARGSSTLSASLHRLGVAAAGDVKQFIVDGTFVPNAASTIAGKGSDKPLIDTGSLRQSITYEIDSGTDLGTG